MEEKSFNSYDAIRFILFGMVLGLFYPKIVTIIGFANMAQIVLGVWVLTMFWKIYRKEFKSLD